MDKENKLPALTGELLMLRVIRELVMDVHELDAILERNGVSSHDFQRWQKTPRFQELLQGELAAWQSAANTGERVKIKAAAMIEEWLPEAFAQMHNDKHPLLHRNDLSKLVASLGGMGKGQVEAASGGERFSVTINLGADQKLNFQKDVTSKVIEGTVNG